MTTTRPHLPALHLPAAPAPAARTHRRNPASLALALLLGLFALPWYLATRHLLPDDDEL